MAYYFPEGTRIYYSSTFASDKTVSAVTNASPAACTSTSHGYSDDGIVLFTSGWEDATDTLFKVDQTDANTFSLLGLNSLNTTFFPSGSGTGTTSLLSTWVEMPQVLTINTSGGAPRFAPVEPLARRNPLSFWTGFEPVNMTVTMGHDATNATYLSMLDLSRVATRLGFKTVGGSGGVTYAYGQMAVSESVRYQRGQANQVDVGITVFGRQISYSS